MSETSAEQPTTAQAEGAAEAASSDAPPWGDSFDANKAWKTIQDQRQELKAIKADKTPQDEKDAKLIADLKRKLESTQSPEDVKREMAQTIGKALGLVEDEPIDPAKLTESLTAAQAEAKRAQVALAVYQNATSAGGDPVALLDSTTFLKAVEALDPTDPAAVTAAIQSAVTANPRLGAAPGEPRPPAPNPAQGSGASGAPGLDAQIADAEKAGDFALSIALKHQRALALKS